MLLVARFGVQIISGLMHENRMQEDNIARAPHPNTNLVQQLALWSFRSSTYVHARVR